MQQRYHKTLEKQIRKFLGSGSMPRELESLLRSVSDTYEQYDESSNIAARAMAVNQEELRKINVKIEQQVETRTRQLQREHARLLASVNGLHAGFIMSNLSGEVVLMNTAAKELLLSHISRDGVVVTDPGVRHTGHWSLGKIDEYLAVSFSLKAVVAGVLSSGTPVEQKAVEYNGRILHIRVTPVLNASDINAEILGAVTLIEDVTEAKVLERSRDEFFSIASHELRTPLTLIRGNAKIMRTYYADKLQDPELSGMIDDMYESSVRLIEIVNDFLDTSRLEQGKMVYKIGPFDIEKAVERIIYEFTKSAQEKGISLIFDHRHLGAVPPVYADENHIKQVLYNLIGNAIKFVGSGSITVRLANIGDFIKVSVADTGPGIPPEAQPLLFRKFQQASSNILTRDSSHGTGLGLYISKLIVEQMGGQIQLESTDPGKGSTFTFTVPIAKG